MIRVKICGITTPEDAELAVELGAAAIGIVFWPNSPRCVEIGDAWTIVKGLPPLVPAIGVFVNQADEPFRMAAEVGLAAVQLHGDESPETYMDRGVTVIKAIAVRDELQAIEAAASVPGDAHVLLDAHDPERRGGTGRGVDWAIAARIAARRRVILSGGLNPDNVAEAIAGVRPAAIDVSSGVESAPGRKDPEKLRRLFDVIRHLA